MERYSMFLGRKNQYCENDYTAKCNLQIQRDPYQIINGIFHRTRTKKKITIHIETKKTPNSQSSLEKEEWGWRNQPSWLQIILQSYSHQDSMVLAQKHKYRPMEQDRKPRNKSTTYGYLWRRQWQPTPVFLPGESHGRRSLVGCSPWGHKESDTTEWLHSFILWVPYFWQRRQEYTMG